MIALAASTVAFAIDCLLYRLCTEAASAWDVLFANAMIITDEEAWTWFGDLMSPACVRQDCERRQATVSVY
jgi:hypothetical protein